MSSITHNKKNGFTLIEVLVGTLIIALVSVASYSAFFILARANEQTRNRLHALILSQAALEEVRAESKNSFDTLDSVLWVDIDQNQYPGFHRTIQISTHPANANLKRADIAVSWEDRGQIVQYRNTTILISKPPDPLPANIHGKVTNLLTSAPIKSVNVKVTFLSGTAYNLTTSTNSSGDYTFVESGSGNFQLSPGDWRLDISGVSGYYDFTVNVSNLTSNEDREINIKLEPRPDNAYIKGRFIRSDTGAYLYSYAYLYEGSSYKGRVTNYSGGFTHTITFENTNPRCFTINMQGAYASRYCGLFCDPDGWGKNYNYQGWSSAVVRGDGSINCSSPWNGSTSSDRLCVNPGETLNLGNITVYPIPRANVQGNITDYAGNPAENAYAQILWHNSSSWGTSSAVNGAYNASVPAEQELFPDTSSYYLYVRGCGTVPIVTCCGASTTTTVCSGYTRVGPLYAGDVLTQDFSLSSGQDKTCGTAHGWVKDGSDLSYIDEASVNIGSTTYTEGGLYSYECDDPATYPIGTGWYYVKVSKDGYYYFDSGGGSNSSLRYSTPGRTQISTNSDREYNVLLWPRGYGIVSGKAVVAGTDNAIAGATAQLDYYADGGIDQTTTTDDDGNFVFNESWETWPPPGVVGNNYYSQTTRNHRVTVSQDAYDPSYIDFSLEAGGEANLDIELARHGAF